MQIKIPILQPGESIVRWNASHIEGELIVADVNITDQYVKVIYALNKLTPSLNGLTDCLPFGDVLTHYTMADGEMIPWKAGDIVDPTLLPGRQIAVILEKGMNEALRNATGGVLPSVGLFKNQKAPEPLPPPEPPKAPKQLTIRILKWTLQIRLLH